MSSYLRLGNPQDPEAANSSAEPSDEADAEPLDDIRDAQIDPFSYRPQFTRWDYLKVSLEALHFRTSTMVIEKHGPWFY